MEMKPYRLRLEELTKLRAFLPSSDGTAEQEPSHNASATEDSN